MVKPKLKFWDFKARKAFETTDYILKSKNGKNFAVAKTSTGKDAYRIVSKIFANENK